MIGSPLTVGFSLGLFVSNKDQLLVVSLLHCVSAVPVREV